MTPAGALAPPFKPVPVDNLLMAFPGDVTHLMPAASEIPREFFQPDNDWSKIAQSFFSVGHGPDIEFVMMPGTDGETAYRHLRCILNSFQPKHEHKIAAVAFLLSTWCVEVRNWQVG